MVNYIELIQALTVFFILLVTLYFQYDFKPYIKQQLNFMETEAIVVASITIYCGMYYLSKGIDNYFQVVLFLFILAGNSYFLVYWMYYMSQAAADVLGKYIPVLRYFNKNKEPYSNYVSSCPMVKQGSYIDKDESVQFTLIRKENLKKDVNLLPGVSSMKDILKHSLDQVFEEKFFDPPLPQLITDDENCEGKNAKV